MSDYLMTWQGNAFYPSRGLLLAMQERYETGKAYVVEIKETRSASSHRHFFAQLKDLWQSMPETIGLQFPTVEHLRASALIATGWYDETQFHMANNDEAMKLASYQKAEDTMKAVAVNGNIVVVRSPKSQSMKAMGRKDFQKSKEDVLGYADDIVNGVIPEAA